MCPFLSIPLVGIERLRNDWAGNGWSTPVIAAIGRAGVKLAPWSVDLACISASSELSYQVTYSSPCGPMTSWQPMPATTAFWLTGIGVLSPGVAPPHVRPPSLERIRTICWLGVWVPSKLQHTYIQPILRSCGRLGPPFTSVLLSTAIQFLSSRKFCWLTGLPRLSWTVIGPVQGFPGRLIATVWLNPVKANVPPGASSVLAYALPSSSNATEMSDTVLYRAWLFGSQ